MQRSTGYIKTKGQVSGLISGVRPVEFKVVTHKIQFSEVISANYEFEIES